MRSENRGTKIRTALCVSCVFYVLLGTSHAEELRQLSPIRKTPTVKTLQMKPSATAPSVKSVTPENPSVIPGGDPVTVTLSGSNLNLITSVQVMSKDEVVPDVTAEMGDPVFASREVTITALGEALPGTYQVRLFAGSKAIDLSASVVSVVVSVLSVQTPSSGVTAGKTALGTSPARAMESKADLAKRSSDVTGRLAGTLPESKPSGTVMIDTVPLPEKPASGLPTSRLPDSKKVDTLKIDTVPLPERSTSGPMRTVPQPPTTGEGEKTQIQPLRAPMPPSDTSGAKKLVTTEAKPGLKYVETKEGIKPQPGISDRISPKQGSSTLSNRVGPAQLDEQKLPSGSALKDQDFQIPTADLELIGVEVLVSNGEGFLPHRKIYGDSDLKVLAYFRNSGKNDLTDEVLEGLKISVSTGTNNHTMHKSVTVSGGSIRRGEEYRSPASNIQLPYGIQTLNVKIDSLNKIPESNEKNNEKSIRFEVLPTPAGGVPFADCGVHTLNAKFDAFPLGWHTLGDTDMHGNGPNVFIEGELHKTDTRLIVRGDIEMSEGDTKGNKGDRTTFEMPFINQIYKAPQGCRIKKVEFESLSRDPLHEMGRIGANLKGSKNWETVIAARQGAEPQLFQSALCRGDTDGSETNKIGCKDIALEPLRVHLESVTGPVCVGIQIGLPGRSSDVAVPRGFTGVYPLTRIKGDGEMGGSHSVKEQIKVELKSDREMVTTEHFVRMEELGGDRSTFEGSSAYLLFNTSLDAPGCYIKNVKPAISVGTKGEKEKILKTNNVFRHYWHYIGEHGLMMDALCRADTKGNDSGKLGCKNIEYAVEFINVDLWPTQIQGPPLTSKAIPANLTTSLQLPSSAPMRTLERPIKPR